MDAQPSLLQPVAGELVVELVLPDGRVEAVVGEPGEFVLDSARRGGVDLPSLCEQGWCTRCAARILQGEVDQSAALRFYPEDRQAGFALLCTARPLSRLRVRSHQQQALVQHRARLGLPAPLG